MTEVAFHFGAPDRLAYVCRLLRKAVGSGARVVVLADTDMVQQVDAGLWALSATDFVAHCTSDAEPSVQDRSPVLLVTDLVQVVDPRQVLLNLAEAIPEGFDQFARLIEVVSQNGADRDSARRRWKQYTERGYSITRHDLAVKGAN